MAANAFVRARIEQSVKDQAAEVLAGMGLTVSDVVRITLTKVADEKVLPFELAPNRVTITALERSERGEDIHRAKDTEDPLRRVSPPGS